MSKKWIVCIVVMVSGLFAPAFVCHALNTLDERRAEVSLRLIGHEILLEAGDSTSRVLPIERVADRYKIGFESDFGFNPDDLVATVDSVMGLRPISKSYLVEVEQCATGEVIHSYEVGPSVESDVIPCRQRSQPRDCYTVFITLLNDGFPFEPFDTANSGLVNGDTGEMSDSPYLTSVVIVAPLLLILGLLIILLKKRGNARSIGDPDLIRIGRYMFDKRNMELSFEDSKTELTSKEADLLYVLHTSANDTLEREVILKSVWGDEGDYVGRTLDVFISKLRKKLDADPGVRIANVRGVGYKLILNES